MAAIVMCGSVSSMKALWETKIQNVRDHWEKQSKRPRGRLSVGIWEDRETLARLKEKLATEDGRLVLRLEHEEWKALPGCLVQLSQVQEWQIHRCGLQKIPSFISSFQNLLVLDLSRNGVAEIPKQIGGLTRLRELLLSYNRVQFVPEELSNCESLERLELAMNRDLHQLPDQVKVFFFSLLSIFVGPRWIGSSTQPFKDACSYACLNATCKKHEQNQLLSKLRCLQHLDLSMNLFSVVPPCVLRMPALEWLDMAGNCLHSLPEDINTACCVQDGEVARVVAAEEPAGEASREHQQNAQSGHAGSEQQQTERHSTHDGGHVQPQVRQLPGQSADAGGQHVCHNAV
ncbi:leucine-rich repeat-containing protein 39 isoform X2 [Dunckerocampus dactyliophorus]|uniref:leucine-rich repeat-containing protein 39 isoform X2 n=1 Tax=Dunckerocampus dactyliophorus TaxID=161453 RepID=UPI002406EC33|nr:leucine-rich repeat-containing protein 39 isoform X2 [Dunckerocampus dactyliophorus]